MTGSHYCNYSMYRLFYWQYLVKRWRFFIVVVHVLLYLSRIAYVSVRHNAAARQNNVPSESSFATKSALFGPKNVCPFQILDLTLRLAGIYLENGLDGPMAHQVQKTWAGGMGAALGPHWVQGNALVGGSGGRTRGFRGAKPPEKIWVLRHFKGHFFLNSDTYFSQKMSRNILRKILEKFLFLFSLRFYLLFSNWNNINNTDWGLQEMVNWHADISHAFSQISQSMIPSHVCTDLDYHWIPTDPTVTVRCTYILIDLDHVLKPIVSLLTIKTTK